MKQKKSGLAAGKKVLTALLGDVSVGAPSAPAERFGDLREAARRNRYGPGVGAAAIR
ncbi:MAG: hypothetical protein J0J10_06845 [Bosea sp.]|uniref:hypothetical protein n=1 Tax=Bosea sp. (in: a-proteobacteria) TaxID=1871050 RepID=UPI001AC0DE50|nr:hypothetical protein [Bosea sp. (in: a-proteobacteria)]MBN9468470.1 hypothetical protein [Bosea sp. (in: a-proteobacteria)]